MYVTMQNAYSGVDAQRPVNLQVGHGVVARATSRDFTAGNLNRPETSWIWLYREMDFSQSEVLTEIYTIPVTEALKYP